ncbi:MAG: hypothetical protein METHP_00639 [Methanoregula sp. SKADARSKE-2]|nr:MAG: hypothetical protein METHP_00639 [Methanoregula sp. SKADARSKE-2]
MYFHLILTDNCNLCCSYCRARAFQSSEEKGEEVIIEIDSALPVELSVELPVLYKFLKRDPAPTLTFYGGEPLLRADLITTMVSDAPVSRFMIQTNGLLLDRLPPEIVNRFSTILVSLDGPEGLTDGNRGPGVYRKVMDNVRLIRSNGFTGELIARMTVTEKADIVAAVRWLSQNPDNSFTSIHWQLDADFAGDFSGRRFEKWAETEYNPGIQTLVRDWVDHMEGERKVLRWYPFLDPMEDLLNGRASRLRCGSGYANYSIMTNGHIAPCPVMIGMSDYYVGHISDADPLHLKTVPIGGDCLDCTILGFCGGRCLYSNITHPWEDRERKIVCITVKNLNDALTGALPRVRELIAKKRISLEDFSHEKFNGCEIIP